MTTRSLTRPDHSRSLNGHLDALIVGAGISGIGLGHHLTTKQPGRSFAIVDGRDAIGGTWDLFRASGRTQTCTRSVTSSNHGPARMRSPTLMRSLTTCTRRSPKTTLFVVSTSGTR
jgi:glycine/D-amino acid oxidase-like deaminating enzyme